MLESELNIWGIDSAVILNCVLFFFFKVLYIQDMSSLAVPPLSKALCNFIVYFSGPWVHGPANGLSFEH